MSAAPRETWPVVPSNGTVGILGGGQLGRMLAVAAAQLGLRAHVLAPEEDCPAAHVAFRRTVAPYADEHALTAFAKSVDVVTYEFENVPASAVTTLDRRGVRVAPNARALEAAQDRLLEKQFLNRIGARTAPFFPVDDLASLGEGLKRIGRPAILKTRRLGYDGKGQTLIEDNGDLPATWREANRKAWEEVGATPSILEGFVDFRCELSVIGARAATGEVALYDPPQNTHRGGILRRSVVPADVSEATAAEARRLTAKLLAELDYVGVVGVEFFVLRDGAVLANEFAPRVHNSGHWTLDACAVSQFEQHIRAVCGWPLGATDRHSDAVMDNLIGEEVGRWRELAEQPEVCLHVYGKAAALPGRKMGHATRLVARRAP
jgi:5-(carboxyamino)imidazole ribonucleotide synthase